MQSPVTIDPMALQLLAAQQDSPVLVALFDASDTLCFANPAFRKTYGLAADQQLTWADLMRQNHAEGVGALVQTDDFDAWLTSARSRRGKLPFRAFETDLCDGRWLWMTETVHANGWMLCIASDISELQTSQRVLRQARDVALRAAQTDMLTGISNRAHIMDQLAQRLQELHLRQQPCGIVLLDLDYFKRVNDTYGHLAGDVVLRHFAQTVHESLRREDGFGRIGGEEFMLLFPEIEAAKLERTVLRILGMVGASHPMPDVPQFAYTCSAGVAMLQPDDDVRSVHRKVDEALYAAKAAGRARLVWG